MAISNTPAIPTTTFKTLGLNEAILNAVNDLGFDFPTPIQEQAITFQLSCSKDLIALAQTGTGKTAAFSLPLLQAFDFNQDLPQALILCPTRELCLQISKDLTQFSKYMPKVRIATVYGGSAIQKQITDLEKKAQIIVATPGRMIDLLKRKKANLSQIRYLVLDEADEMLNMGFKEDINTILASASTKRRTLLFSATMPKEIKHIALDYMQDPDRISIANNKENTKNIKDYYYMVHVKDRYKALKRIIDFNPNIYGIIFCQTRQDCKDITQKLVAEGYNCDALHGDLSQSNRDEVMNKFRTQYLQLLIATDVAARGLDVNHLSHVINYSLPYDTETYIHRSGRTGRAGQTGICMSIVHTRRNRDIAAIEQKTNRPFIRQMVPSAKAICEAQLLALLDKIANTTIDQDHINRYLDLVYDKFADISKEELMQRFISVEFNRFLEYYKNAPDLNVKKDKLKQQEYKKSYRKQDFRSSSKQVQFAKINVDYGHFHSLHAGLVINFINSKFRNTAIGKINIKTKTSTIEVAIEYQDRLEQAFASREFKETVKAIKPRKR